LQGETGVAYAIQASASLAPPVSWEVLTNVIPTSAVHDVGRFGAAQIAYRFFRAERLD
jgi:hypothetical protein